MIPLFLGLTAANLIGLGIAAGLGYATGSRHDLGQWHILAGALAALGCCAAHCVVFTYFIATAKWVQHAIDLRSLDPKLGSPTRSFKAQAFPAALAGMSSTFIAAAVGAATSSYGFDTIYHHLLALTAIAVNFFAAIAEYSAISRNGRLIDEVLEQANRGTA